MECTQSHFSLLLLLLAAAAACRRGACVAPYAPGYSCCCPVGSPNQACSCGSYFIQGNSHWNVKSNLGMTDINMLVRFCLKVFVWFWGLDIWVSSTNFQKSNIDWPQQPPIEKVLKFSKNFHDSVKIMLVLRLLNSRTRITLKSSVVIFQALETSTASLTSVTSAASATSLASTASTAPFL